MILRELKRNGREVRLLVLGLENSGKTTILKKLSDEDITHVMPTQGSNAKSLVQNEFKISVWDTGCPDHRGTNDFKIQYYDQTDALIYVIDSTDRQCMDETGAELAKLLAEEKLNGILLIFFANKQDLLNACPPEEIAEFIFLRNFEEDRNWHVQGLQFGMEWVVENIANTGGAEVH